MRDGRDPTAGGPGGAAATPGAGASRPSSRRPGTDVLILGSDELAEAIPLPHVIDGVERAYRLHGEGRLVQHPRVPVRQAGVRTFLHVMPALTDAAGVAGVHVYTGGNRGADVPQKVTLVFRVEDGALRAIIESNWLSWARTGATGAVATRHLARPEADVLGIIGTGRQAAAQLQAIAATRRLRRVNVFSPTPAHRTAFAEEMSRRTGIDVVALASGDAVVAASDIVSTTTTSHEPVFDGSVAQAGLHVNAIGAHYPDRRELDGVIVGRARLFADDAERSRIEDGELLLATGEGQLAAGVEPVALGSVVAGRARGRSSADDITVFLSGGLGGEYVAVAAAIVDEAEALGLGRTVRL